MTNEMERKSFVNYYLFYTLSGCMGKVVASHAAVARSSPADVALIHIMRVALRGCDQSIGSTVSDTIVHS